MKHYKKIVLAALLAIVTGVTASAMPVLMKRMTVTQPNGVTVTILTEGDEFYHLSTTTDGAAVEKCMDGYVRYLNFENGRRIVTNYTVGQDNIPSAVISAAKDIPYFEMKEAGRAMRALDYESATLRAMKQEAAAVKPTEDTPRQIKGAVILVQFQDVKFTLGNKELFERMLNEEGFSDNGATGSAVDYFKSQFGDKADFHFDVYGPYTAENDLAYYGGNSYGGSDQRPGDLVAEACEGLDGEINFADYDMDGDGECDFVFMFFAGFDEARGGGADCIWSHKHALYTQNLYLDGVKIFTYACTSELMGYNSSTAEFAAIGTFCHEFGHVLGLADLYDTSYNADGYPTAKGCWGETSIMDGGAYNNNSHTPPYYNSFEREMLGILEPTPATEGEFTLDPISGNQCIRIETDVENEYFIMEYRHREGWDKNLSSDGLLVYHIDMSNNPAGKSYYYGRNVTAQQRWAYNEVNSYPDHQCANLVEASNSNSGSVISVYFPGSRKVTSCSSLSHDEYICWSGKVVPFDIQDITLGEKNVTFRLTAASGDAAPVATNQEVKVIGTNVLVSWDPSRTTEEEVTSKVTLYRGFTEVSVTENIEKDYIIFDNLEAGKEYTAVIEYTIGSIVGEPVEVKFTTTANTYNFPYILMNRSQFKKDKAVAFNIANVKDEGQYTVTWFLDNSEVSIPDNYLLSFEGSKELRAVITYSDGRRETVSMTITL